MTRPRLAGHRRSSLLAIGADSNPKPTSDAYPSPIALALSTDGARLLVANQGTGSVALVDPKAGKVLAEVATGDKPAGVALSKDGKRAVVTHWYGYDLAILDVRPDGLKVVGRVDVGPEPRGVVLSEDGSTAYVAVGASNEVVRVDLDAKSVTGRLAVGREPRGLAITPDGKTLSRRECAVGRPLDRRRRPRGRSSGRSPWSPARPTCGRSRSTRRGNTPTSSTCGTAGWRRRRTTSTSAGCSASGCRGWRSTASRRSRRSRST